MRESMATGWYQAYPYLAMVLGVILYFFNDQIRNLASNPAQTPDYHLLGILFVVAGIFVLARRAHVI